ncbi:hypothetical protein ABXN37_01515 [Piscinibacter sakaiensis]|uniref:hypothetical protein n=1 Tax=Piscinibacter sakaiensis TaxID=1547922 RepID=UPI0037271D0B
MLQLQAHQLDGFALDAERRFERQLLDAVAERLAGPGDPPVAAARLQALVREGLALAERLGMDSEAHVAQVTMLHAASRCRPLVPDLLSPWAQEALQRPASTPTTRLGWIRGRLVSLR